MVSNEEMEELYQANNDGWRVCTKVTWSQDYADCCRRLWYHLVPKMLALSANRSYEDVRFVFWFNN